MHYKDYQFKVHLKSKEVCHYLSISRSTLNRLIKKGTLNAYKIDEDFKGVNLFKFSEVKDLLTKIPSEIDVLNKAKNKETFEELKNRINTNSCKTKKSN